MMDILITRVFWKRTYLFIEYEAKKEVKLSLAKVKREYDDEHINFEYLVTKQIDMETKCLEKNKYRSKLNITIAEGRDMLTSGNWKIIVNDDPYIRPAVTDEIILNIEDLSRVYRYGDKKFYCYIVTFGIDNIMDEEGHETISIAMNTSFMRKNRTPYVRKISDAFQEARTLKGKSKKIAFIIVKRLLNVYYQIVSHLTSKKGKKVLFMSENRTHIMDNLEAIDRRLKERGLDKEYKISYSFRNIFDGNRQKPLSWLKVITKIAKADVIFVDDYVPVFSFLNLHKKQTLVQVWHAGFGFKLVGYARFGIGGSPRPVESCHRKYTYGLIGNDNLKEIYSEVWGIPRESLLPTGMPRLEHFLDKDHIEKVRKDFYEKYPQFKGKKVITFATTYRGLSQRSAYYDYTKIDFAKLYKYCKKNNAMVIFERHHFLLDPVPIDEKYQDLIYDLSDLKLNDLFYITDVLITDYSSAFYDYLLLNKPVLFYTYDKAVYSATRGVHRPVDKVAPGKVCGTFDELIESLEKCDYGDKEKVDFLKDNCLINTKLASDQVIDFIILKKGDFESCRK